MQQSIRATLSVFRGFQGTLGREDHLDQMESQYVTTHTHVHTPKHNHATHSSTGESVGPAVGLWFSASFGVIYLALDKIYCHI